MRHCGSGALCADVFIIIVARVLEDSLVEQTKKDENMALSLPQIFVFGNCMIPSDYTSPQRERLGAQIGFWCICCQVLWLLLKYCICCICYTSVPPLQRIFIYLFVFQA